MKNLEEMENNTENSAEENDGLNCKGCAIPLKGGRHGNTLFCSPKCKNSFFNMRAKSNRLEQEYFVSQLKKKEVEKRLKERILQNFQIESQWEGGLSDNQLILDGLNIPPEGRVFTSEEITSMNFHLDIYKEQKQIKNTSFKYLEYGRFGVFFVGIERFLIAPIKNYVTWI